MGADRVVVDASLEGREYPPYSYEVSREKIREYARALGETDPRYFSDGEDCVAPPTFAASFTIIRGAEPLFDDDDLGLHWNLVHGSQKFEFGRPARPGDVITCTPRFAGVTVRAGNEFVRIEVDCRFDDDSLAVLSTSSLVLLGDGPEEA